MSEDKVCKTVNKITIKIKEILEEDPNFTGDIYFSFCLGGITGIEKTEKIKIK